jgi:ubiquitin carboxyl-terminal hydrolase 34
VYNLLLGLLGRAKLYVDAAVHGTTKLVQYFSFMTYCLISKTEKLMFSGYFMDLWNLFQVRGRLKGLCLLWEELSVIN